MGPFRRVSQADARIEAQHNSPWRSDQKWTASDPSSLDGSSELGGAMFLYIYIRVVFAFWRLFRLTVIPPRRELNPLETSEQIIVIEGTTSGEKGTNQPLGNNVIGTRKLSVGNPQFRGQLYAHKTTVVFQVRAPCDWKPK